MEQQNKQKSEHSAAAFWCTEHRGLQITIHPEGQTISLFISWLVILSNSFILSKVDLVRRRAFSTCGRLTETKSSLTFSVVVLWSSCITAATCCVLMTPFTQPRLTLFAVGVACHFFLLTTKDISGSRAKQRVVLREDKEKTKQKPEVGNHDLKCHPRTPTLHWVNRLSATAPTLPLSIYK